MTGPERDTAGNPEHRPDVTEAVLRRLGLAGLTPREAKRRRRRRAQLRALACVVIAAAGGVVFVLVSSPPQPSAPTIPSAVRHDLTVHGQTIDRTVRSIRGLGGQLPAVPAPATPPGEAPGETPGAEVDEPAAGPSV